MAEITYSPDSLVWTTRATFVDWLVSVTVAPGTASPLASVTMPLISPDGVCPRTGVARVKTTRRRTPEARLRIGDLSENQSFTSFAPLARLANFKTPRSPRSTRFDRRREDIE